MPQIRTGLPAQFGSSRSNATCLGMEAVGIIVCEVQIPTPVSAESGAAFCLPMMSVKPSRW